MCSRVRQQQYAVLQQQCTYTTAVCSECVRSVLQRSNSAETFNLVRFLLTVAFLQVSMVYVAHTRIIAVNKTAVIYVCTRRCVWAYFVQQVWY